MTHSGCYVHFRARTVTIVIYNSVKRGGVPTFNQNSSLLCDITDLSFGLVSFVQKFRLELNYFLYIHTTENASIFQDQGKHPLVEQSPILEQFRQSSHLKFAFSRIGFGVYLCLTHPTPGIEPSGRMRCAISSMSSVSKILYTLAYADKSHRSSRAHLINLTGLGVRAMGVYPTINLDIVWARFVPRCITYRQINWQSIW